MNLFHQYRLFTAFAFCYFGFFMNSLNGQSTPLLPGISGPVNIPSLMKVKPVSIGELKPLEDTNNLVLEMPFSEAYFSDPKKFKKLPDAKRVFAVYLFYTRYKESDSFSQPKLNEQRFVELKKFFPALYNYPGVVWSVVEQVKAKERDKAAKTFHGFVIYLKNTEMVTQIETVQLEIDRLLKNNRDTIIIEPEIVTYKVKKKRIKTGDFEPKSKKKKEKGILYKKPGIWNREEISYIRLDSTPVVKKKASIQKRVLFDSGGLENLNEYEILTQRMPGAKTTIVMDVTGSMGPYILQVLMWLKRNPEMVKQGRFLFFNDGDNMPDELKKIGKTGGLYPITASKMEEIQAVMYKAMLNGQGGDMPENNLEALLEAQKQWPVTDTFLMISDNKAPLKDYALVKQLKKPVNILLCGVENVTNPHLFILAKETGGKLMFGDVVLTKLNNFKTGDIITVSGAKWRFENNIFSKL